MPVWALRSGPTLQVRRPRRGARVARREKPRPEVSRTPGSPSCTPFNRQLFQTYRRFNYGGLPAPYNGTAYGSLLIRRTSPRGIRDGRDGRQQESRHRARTRWSADDDPSHAWWLVTVVFSRHLEVNLAPTSTRNGGCLRDGDHRLLRRPGDYPYSDSSIPFTRERNALSRSSGISSM